MTRRNQSQRRQQTPAGECAQRLLLSTVEFDGTPAMPQDRTDDAVAAGQITHRAAVAVDQHLQLLSAVQRPFIDRVGDVRWSL